MHTSTSSAPRLNFREVQVLKLSAHGKSQAEIAQDLYVSFDTVKAYNKSLRQKLDAPTIANAVFKAMKMHLIE